MSKKNKGGGNKLTNIIPGTICELVHNDSVMFRIIHVNDCGYPFSDLSVHVGMGYDGFTEGNHCVAYTPEYKECTPERKKMFFELVDKCRDERMRNLFITYETIREDGMYNMITDADVIMYEMGVDKDTYFNIIKNYNELRKKYENFL